MLQAPTSFPIQSLCSLWHFVPSLGCLLPFPGLPLYTHTHQPQAYLKPQQLKSPPTSTLLPGSEGELGRLAAGQPQGRGAMGAGRRCCLNPHGQTLRTNPTGRSQGSLPSPTASGSAETLNSAQVSVPSTSECSPHEWLQLRPPKSPTNSKECLARRKGKAAQ